MTEERFSALAGAYGADPDRWPDAERAAAAAFLAVRPAEAEPILDAERRLDGVLAAYAVEGPRRELRVRILAAAPRQRALGRTFRWLAATGLGLGLAAACAAGVAVGVTLTPHSVTRVFEAPGGGGPDVSSLADPAGDPGEG